MVKKATKNGGFYHEPPYTEEEELALYRHGPSFTVLHSNRPPAAAPKHPLPKSPPRRPAK